MTSTSFDSAIQTLIPKFLKMLRLAGIRDPGSYYHIDHFGFVFKKGKDWFKEVFSILMRYFSKRAERIEHACERKGVKPYGRLLEFTTRLRTYSEMIHFVMLD